MAQSNHEVLDPVTVSSSLVATKSSATGRNITSIKGAYFENLPINSLDQLLKFIPGVEVQSRGPLGAQSDISLRGSTFQQVLVLLDGLRINDPNTGHFSGYLPITPSQIDRIEVLKGAASSVYGADALGGVIHIITKAFEAQKQKITLETNAQVGVGAYGLWNVNAGGFYKNNTVAVDAGILTNHTSGVQQRGIKGYNDNTTASVGISLSPTENWTIAYRGVYDNRDFAAQNFYTTSIADTAQEVVKTWWHQAKIGYQKSKSKFTVDAAYKTLDDTFLFNKSGKANTNNSKLYQALAQYQYSISEKNNLITGFNWIQKNIVSNDRGTHTINSYAPFITYYHKLFEKLVINPSIRAEFIGDNNAEFLPQLNLAYKLQKVQLRGSIGRTIRDADFTERYNNYNKATVGTGQRIGNPWLLAERAISSEIGADIFLSENLKISTSLFNRSHTNLIDWTNTPYADMPRKDNLVNTGTYGLAKNISELTTKGWETDVLLIQPLNNTSRVYMNAGFVWMDIKSENKQPSLYIANSAKFLANFLAMYENKWFDMSLTGLYKNRMPQTASNINASITKDYFLMNAKLSAHIWQQKLKAFVQVDNIFDRQYSDLLGAIMPGRWTQAGVQFQFSK